MLPNSAQVQCQLAKRRLGLFGVRTQGYHAVYKTNDQQLIKTSVTKWQMNLADDSMPSLAQTHTGKKTQGTGPPLPPHPKDLLHSFKQAAYFQLMQQLPPEVPGQEMAGVLMVAETPAAARLVAECLSGSHARMRQGVAKGLPVHEFFGAFMGQRAHIHVTAIQGRLSTLDFQEQGTKMDELRFFAAPCRKRMPPEKMTVLQHLQHEAEVFPQFPVPGPLVYHPLPPTQASALVPSLVAAASGPAPLGLQVLQPQPQPC